MRMRHLTLTAALLGFALSATTTRLHAKSVDSHESYLTASIQQTEHSPGGAMTLADFTSTPATTHGKIIAMKTSDKLWLRTIPSIDDGRPGCLMASSPGGHAKYDSIASANLTDGKIIIGMASAKESGSYMQAYLAGGKKSMGLRAEAAVEQRSQRIFAYSCVRHQVPLLS